MDFSGSVFGLINLFFAAIIGIYFWHMLRTQQGGKVAVDRESRKEMEKLRKMRSISLTEPLSEKTRPNSLQEIIGQEEGLRALRAALCGPNPQHVIIYGPPGVGKTAAARAILEEAKKNPKSPFRPGAKFVEIDGATSRFDDRGIADPLIGSVHDPIYQGAGAMGMAGIPQPKPGAVTKAHGGILFIDEIGELHPIQINKLLKVLEDRKVFLESAYYNSEDPNIPQHIHDIFQNGLPADFRLVGATTKTPHDIPPAVRSRCIEVFFRALSEEEVGIIASNAAKKAGFQLDEEALEVIKKYASNGRDAVNILQIAGGSCISAGRSVILKKDIEWVVSAGQYAPRCEPKPPPKPRIGYVNGLAIRGPNMGSLIEIEAVATLVEGQAGKLVTTGLVDEEELGGQGRIVKRKSMARGSVENVATILKRFFSLNPEDYDIHVNFPGGLALDGPSAGIAIVTAIYSAITQQLVDNKVAMTGEVSILGDIRPVGGIVPKVEAAAQAGVERVIIPRENWQEVFRDRTDIRVLPVDRIEEAVKLAVVCEEPILGLLDFPNVVTSPSSPSVTRFQVGC
ncbi:MAG TPA: ATP-dependent protease LonB [Bacillota bacterium]|jgi:Lon-like ATP-dependent protease|nr:ATP-dependent protease LonB [Bacillota bacterium]HOJ57009.1 ATP-dependent protease LonB [Bacillota bacterium]HOL01687.1 ATP-dependent protease LonB [Bacillota bacterium]HPU60526.1 ATP-dependent protease LonB [Bacillota bacterium]HPZ91569.1 ATP-dependent protease LonB [Bacillota bacterium]